VIEALLEILIETFGELILQVLFEALTEVGIHLTRKEPAQPRSPALLVVGYATLGVLAGLLSLIVFSHSLAHSPNGRLATLLLVPLLAALATVWIGRMRVRRGQVPAGIDRFMLAYVFALGMACVRYLGAS